MKRRPASHLFLENKTGLGIINNAEADHDSPSIIFKNQLTNNLKYIRINLLHRVYTFHHI